MANEYERAMMFAIANIERQEAQNVRQPFGIKIDPLLALSDHLFIKTYRLSKVLTKYLIELVTPFMEPPKRTSALSIQNKVINNN